MIKPASGYYSTLLRLYYETPEDAIRAEGDAIEKMISQFTARHNIDWFYADIYHGRNSPRYQGYIGAIHSILSYITCLSADKLDSVKKCFPATAFYDRFISEKFTSMLNYNQVYLVHAFHIRDTEGTEALRDIIKKIDPDLDRLMNAVQLTPMSGLIMVLEYTEGHQSKRIIIQNVDDILRQYADLLNSYADCLL